MIKIYLLSLKIRLHKNMASTSFHPKATFLRRKKKIIIIHVAFNTSAPVITDIHRARRKMAGKQQKHFVLVHGACHGAWAWYKLIPLLKSSGHRVTALDLAASGVHPRPIHELTSFHDYSEPLMEFMASVPAGQKVILVGHSIGGINLALAMDHFPEKISVAVFLTALIPDTDHCPSYVVEQLFSERFPEDFWLDTQFSSRTESKPPLDLLLVGPKFCRSKLYQRCSIEDYTLATMLMRPAALFLEDMSKAKNFSCQGYGSIQKIYIMCSQDQGLPVEFQQWMIKNSGVGEVTEIKDADHMAMLSKPLELCDCLLKIANNTPKSLPIN